MSAGTCQDCGSFCKPTESVCLACMENYEFQRGWDYYSEMGA